MSGWSAKRVWTETRVEEVDGGFTVQLDGRAVKTPAKTLLVVPTRAIADQIAAEWQAQQDKADAIFKAHDPGKGGGGVFAHGMADQCRRGDAPAFIKLSQREFGDHDQGQLHRGLFQDLIGRSLGALFGQP